MLKRSQVPDDLIGHFEEVKKEVRVAVVRNYHPT